MSESPPAQSLEQDDIMTYIMNCVDASSTIQGAIFITLGYDGRPCVTSNMPADATQEILRVIGGFEPTNVTEHQLEEKH